ncbi:NmrA family NAD(P)-binding protein [Cryptosporangium phraense]|uniref:NmrA/HSCARG family protein n=1 Tax=Cryptosporangium phraense TaxID=2593070 RepID=A0A545AN42_9ACTN|nr:NmrA family NAD(P)-binding protein [Cryptosporangium phraense]TQS42706.1 NmrA/HSCARG family protein [Cryptosporangium phraense]
MRPVLVARATGRQGSAATRALLAQGTPVRALVRDPDHPRARALADADAEVVATDYDDPASLRAAADGVRGVFSVQLPDLENLLGDAEVRHGRNLVDAAVRTGVEQIVHTSVSGTGRPLPDPEKYGEHMPHYWRTKAQIEDFVRTSGVEHWTILRPSTFMENLIRPSFYFANGTDDRLLVAHDPDVPQPWIATDDIGAAAAAAFADPARFDGVELELAGDRLSMREVAKILSDVLGTEIALPAEGEGPAEHFARAQRYSTDHPAPARPEFAHAQGLTPRTLADWASVHLR